MTTPFAFVFPGQGSQSLNMMAGFAGHPQVKATFDEASTLLGLDLWQLAGSGPEAALNQTVNTQPLMLAAGVAAYRVWQALGGAAPAVVAGVLAALVVTGSGPGSLDCLDAAHLRTIGSLARGLVAAS